MDDTKQQPNVSAAHPLLLQASGLERRIGDRVLLNDVCLAIHGGDRIAIVGPTGSGKTLLLRSLAMLDPVSAGGMRRHGTPVQGNEVSEFRSRVIYLHQRPALIEGTVEDNLRQPFSLRVHHNKHFNRGRIVDLLESLGHGEPFLSKQQRDLSGGEGQLTALLRAIQLDPDVLLLDEPTAALDGKSTGMVEALVSNWLAERPGLRATVWVTHDHNQARRVSSKLLPIREGRLSGGANERLC